MFIHFTRTKNGIASQLDVVGPVHYYSSSFQHGSTFTATLISPMSVESVVKMALSPGFQLQDDHRGDPRTDVTGDQGQALQPGQHVCYLSSFSASSGGQIPTVAQTACVCVESLS